MSESTPNFPDKIASIRQHALDSLQQSLVFYHNNVRALRIIHMNYRGQPEAIRFEPTDENKNQVGTNGEDFLASLQFYISNEIPIATLGNLATVFEAFVFDFLETWIFKFSKSLAGENNNQVKVDLILECDDKDEIVRRIITNKVIGLQYGGPNKWIEYVEKCFGIRSPEKLFTDAQINQLVEIKASRDIFQHASGKINHTYLKKSGSRSRGKLGDELKIPKEYLLESYEMLKTIIETIGNSAENKARKNKNQ